MKNFLTGLVAAMILILPNIALADTLDDFKNVLAGKHFFIKYTLHSNSDYQNDTKTGKGVLIKDKGGSQIIDKSMFQNLTYNAIEAYDGNNFYTESGAQRNIAMPETKKSKMLDAMSRLPITCNLKIGDRLFSFIKTETQGKPVYNNNAKTATYQEVDEEFSFTKTRELETPMGTVEGYEYKTLLSPAIIALLNEEDDPYSGKILYRRAGSGTTEDGLEYFDLKADKNSDGYLNAIRYCFKDGVIKKIILAIYSKNQQTGEITGSRTIIDVEEFNTNPDPKYFKLPDSFKKIEKSESWQ